MCSYAYEVIKEYEKGLEHIDKALIADPYNDWYWERKTNIVRSLPGREKESLSLAEKAVALNPNSFFALSTFSRVCYSLKKYDEALISVEKSINLHEDSSFSWCLKGHILVAMNSPDLIDIVKCYAKARICANKFTPHEMDLEIIVNNIKSLSKGIPIHIFNLGTTQDIWLKDGQDIIEIYAQHNIINDLSGGLVESIKAINEPSSSDHTAQAWLEMWQNLAGQYDEFQVALNLLKVAVEYKINRDRRVLLQLPQEERQILEELLNPETI
jgi:tetratricopeptide (TPR) repeat protein